MEGRRGRRALISDHFDGARAFQVLQYIDLQTGTETEKNLKKPELNQCNIEAHSILYMYVKFFRRGFSRAPCMDSAAVGGARALPASAGNMGRAFRASTSTT